MELVISIVVGMVLYEIYAWLPEISTRLLERAVSRMHAEDQERYREEWNAYLNELPNTLVKLIHAFSYNMAAYKIRDDIYQKVVDNIGSQIKTISDNHYVSMKKLIAVKRVYAEYDGPQLLEDQVKISISALNESRVSSGPSREVLPQAVKNFEELGQSLIGATRRARDLMRMRIDRADAMLNQRDPLIKMVSEKYSRIDVLRKRRLFPSRGLAAAMENLAENLGKLSVMNEVCEDDTIIHEYNKIMNTIRRVSNNLQNRCK